MGYRHHLRLLRRAHRWAKAQQQARLTLERAGFVALPRHPATTTLTVPIERGVGALLANALRGALREHRCALQAALSQRRRDGGKNDYHRGPAGQPVTVRTPAPASVPPGGATDRAPPPAAGKRPQS